MMVGTKIMVRNLKRKIYPTKPKNEDDIAVIQVSDFDLHSCFSKNKPKTSPKIFIIHKNAGIFPKIQALLNRILKLPEVNL